MIGRKKLDDKLRRIATARSSANGSDEIEQLKSDQMTAQGPSRRSQPPPVCTGTRGRRLESKHGGECGFGQDKPRVDRRSVYRFKDDIGDCREVSCRKPDGSSSLECRQGRDVS